MLIVSLFEAKRACGEKPLEAKETPFAVFNLGNDCINHGMSTSWDMIMLWLDEKTGMEQCA